MLIGGRNEALRRARYNTVRFTRGTGIDLGAGPYKGFPHFAGVRRKDDETMVTEGDNPRKVAPDVEVDSFEKMDDLKDGNLDFAYIHDIEYTPDIHVEVNRKLKVGAHLVLIDSVVNEDGSSQSAIIVQKKVGLGTDDYERVSTKPLAPEGQKKACVVRFGAIGDMLQAGCITAELRRQGYYVVMMTHTDAAIILSEDKSIDEFWLQDKDQVPNTELHFYWREIAPMFDKMVNLSESVEGALLLYPGRANYMWPMELRHELCNTNYLEHMTKIADLRGAPLEHHYYPTEAEVAKAAKRFAKGYDAHNKHRKPRDREPTFNIAIALEGSAAHKMYPHLDAVIARILLEIPQAQVFLLGGPGSKPLEGGWQNEKRVHCLAGELSLRDSLSLSLGANLVMGPETGVLNAVAFESMAKIVYLSHSTVENLTRDWVNTESMVSTVTPCYPCHRMHLSREFCPTDEATGGAQCQADISPAVMWDAVHRAFTGWNAVNNLLKP